MKWMRFPFKTLLVMGLLSFVLVDYPPLKLTFAHTKDMVKKAEFYPLSSFSMYSTFSETPFLVFITDGAGQKIAIDSALKTHASELKKTYEMRLKALKKQGSLPGKLTDLPLAIKAEAGRDTLELLKARPSVQKFLASRDNQILRLHEIILSAGDDGIVKREQWVAQL
jgi:hypothetical protein